jgi:hypothetical protein
MLCTAARSSLSFRRVRSALMEGLTLEDADDAELKVELDGRRESRQPIFVVLGAQGMSADWLERLCGVELFAWVNFLILTGKAGSASGLLPDEAILKPLLPAGFESKVWGNYDARGERNADGTVATGFLLYDRVCREVRRTLILSLSRWYSP